MHGHKFNDTAEPTMQENGYLTELGLYAGSSATPLRKAYA